MCFTPIFAAIAVAARMRAEVALLRALNVSCANRLPMAAWNLRTDAALHAACAAHA